MSGRTLFCPFSSSTISIRLAIWLAILLVIWPQLVSAHGGGTPRVTREQVGPYNVYAWSEPEPLRQGDTHLTIAVTLPSEKPVLAVEDEVMITDADVMVTYTPIDVSIKPVSIDAVAIETLGTVYYDAVAELPASGEWKVEISVVGREGEGSVSFDAFVLPPQRNTSLLLAGAGLALVLAVALLFVRSRFSQKAGFESTRRRRKQQVIGA